LIFGKVSFVLLLIISLVIISLEARLFGVGRSVFGLFCIVTLFIACTLAYFLLVVDSLKRTYKLHYELLKHPQTASPLSGVTNRSFVEDFDKVTTVRQHQQQRQRRHVHYDEQLPHRNDHQHPDHRQRHDHQRHEGSRHNERRRPKESEIIALQEFSNRTKPSPKPKRGTLILDASKL
jgi:hypothetical protein